MELEMLKLFRCPECKSGNLLVSEAPGEMIEAKLACDSCGCSIPIKNNIPRFVGEKNYTDSFGYQWNIHRQTQLDSYTGLPISRSRLFTVTQWDEDLRGQRVLEAGSGAGRFTEILLQTGASLYSFDYSAAVDANFINNGLNRKLALFQGDIFHIPLQPESFDKVICLGVLQHTPDPQRAFMCLTEMVRPGGELVIDIYANTLIARMQWYYLLRPITRRMDKNKLYSLISIVVPRLIPIARFLRAAAGRVGARLVPIAEYSHFGLSPEINKEWAILDTFDMYSPVHDHPQNMSTVQRWFETAGFTEVTVRRGPNGIVGKGRKV